MYVEDIKWRLKWTRIEIHTTNLFVGCTTGEALVGFSTESILKVLGGTLDPLLGAIKNGSLRGVTGLLSCTTLRDSGQDVHSVRIEKDQVKAADAMLAHIEANRKKQGI